MKAMILLAIAFLSVTAFAETNIKRLSDNNELQILDLIVGVKQTYSKSSGLEAKVIEVLAGDGMNPTRMILVLRDAETYQAHMYELSVMMYQLTRITFLDIDTIVINYVQDTFDNVDDMNVIQVKKSLKIKALRDADKNLSGEISVEEI